MKKFLILIAAVVILGVGWYLASPLFIDKMVDEAFPALSEERQSGVEDEPGLVEAGGEVSKSTQNNEPILLVSGSFVDVDVIHKGSGKAQVYELTGGVRTLRFEDFEVTNGPGLHVVLSAHANPRTQAEVKDGGYVDLGELKGNIGNQNYTLSGDIDLSLYQSVVIYCYPFNVVFSTATLQ